MHVLFNTAPKTRFCSLIPVFVPGSVTSQARTYAHSIQISKTEMLRDKCTMSLRASPAKNAPTAVGGDSPSTRLSFVLKVGAAQRPLATVARDFTKKGGSTLDHVLSVGISNLGINNPTVIRVMKSDHPVVRAMPADIGVIWAPVTASSPQDVLEDYVKQYDEQIKKELNDFPNNSNRRDGIYALVETIRRLGRSGSMAGPVTVNRSYYVFLLQVILAALKTAKTHESNDASFVRHWISLIKTVDTPTTRLAIAALYDTTITTEERMEIFEYYDFVNCRIFEYFTTANNAFTSPCTVMSTSPGSLPGVAVAGKLTAFLNAQRPGVNRSPRTGTTALFPPEPDALRAGSSRVDRTGRVRVAGACWTSYGATETALVRWRSGRRLGRRDPSPTRRRAPAGRVAAAVTGTPTWARARCSCAASAACTSSAT